jgi:hypothetical protein
MDTDRLFDERKRQWEVLNSRQAYRDPVGGRAPNVYPFVERTFGHALADLLPCQPNIQPFVSVKVGDLPVPGEVGGSVTSSGRALNHPGERGEPPFQLVPN